MIFICALLGLIAAYASICGIIAALTNIIFWKSAPTYDPDSTNRMLGIAALALGFLGLLLK